MVNRLLASGSLASAIADSLVCAGERSSAETTTATRNSAVNAWNGFCDLFELNRNFLDDDGGLLDVEMRQQVLKPFIAFEFVRLMNPRSTEKTYIPTIAFQFKKRRNNSKSISRDIAPVTRQADA